MTWFIANFDTSRDYILQFTITYTLVPTFTPLLLLLGSSFNDIYSPPSGFLNCPQHQLPASNSNSSQRLHPSRSLTDCNWKSKLYYDRQSVSQSVLVSSIQLGPKTRFLLLLDSCRFVDVGRPLWQKDRSVVYNCCWPLPVQSFLGLSPAGLMTIFYCLRFDTLPTWRVRSPYLYPPGTGWHSYTPRHWVPFSSPPTTHRDSVDICEPAFTWGDCNC
jgi:hypothetical protein